MRLHIDPAFNIPRTSNRRFNTSLLYSDPFYAFVLDSLSQFWLDNKDFPVSSAIIWDVAKPTLCRHLISYTSHLNRAQESNRKTLKKKLELG